MKTIQKNTFYVCGCCKRSLSAAAFYLNKKTGTPDNYCKECRKSYSRKQRVVEKRVIISHPEEYPVITQTGDPVLRKELILHALQVVAESMARKKRKLAEAVEAELEAEAEWKAEAES